MGLKIETLLPDCWVGFMLDRDVFRFFRTKVHNFCHIKANRACFDCCFTAFSYLCCVKMNWHTLICG